jgi:hypothetical protein
VQASLIALNGTHAFPAAAKLFFRMIKRGRVALHPDLDLRINVNRDRPEPAQLPGCLAILVHAPDLTAILSVDRGGDAGRTQDEGHARIVQSASGHRQTGYDRRIVDFTTGVCWLFCNRIAGFWTRALAAKGLLDHLIGATEQHQRHRYAKRPGGLFLAVHPLRKPAIGWANQRS